MSQAPPGWYQDVEDWENERYWNGERWTDAVRPRQAAESVPATAPTPAPAPEAIPKSAQFVGPNSESAAVEIAPNAIGRVAAWSSAVGGLVLTGAVVLGVYVYDQSGLGDDVSALSDDADPGTVYNEDDPCEDLADEAVRISDESDAMVKLLKVRAPEVVTDNRSTYDVPSGTEEELVLLCEGAGVWSTGMNADVRIRLTVDSDGDSWVYFRPVS